MCQTEMLEYDCGHHSPSYMSFCDLARDREPCRNWYGRRRTRPRVIRVHVCHSFACCDEEIDPVKDEIQEILDRLQYLQSSQGYPHGRGHTHLVQVQMDLRDAQDRLEGVKAKHQACLQYWSR